MPGAGDLITQPGSFPQGSPLAFSVLLSLGGELLQMLWMEGNRIFELNLLAVILIIFPVSQASEGIPVLLKNGWRSNAANVLAPCRVSLFEFGLQIYEKALTTN